MKTLHVNPLSTADVLKKARQDAIKEFHKTIKGMSLKEFKDLFQKPVDVLIDRGELGFKVQFNKTLKPIDSGLTLAKGELMAVIDNGLTIDTHKEEREFMSALESGISQEIEKAVVLLLALAKSFEK